MRLADYRQLVENPYRIQSLNALRRGESFRGKLYSTFEAAQKAAHTQAQNASNVKNDNPFVVYKAVAIIGTPLPTPAPKITSYPIPENEK